MERRGDRDLDPKLVGAVRLALADAFDLGRVQRIDFPLALMLALLAHPARQHERMAEDTLQFGFALDLAADVANDPAKISQGWRQRPRRQWRGDGQSRTARDESGLPPPRR